MNRNSNYYHIPTSDYGPDPFAVNLERAAIQNQNYRTVLWTGQHLQLALMSIPVGGEIGLEVHPDTDQFIQIVSGNAVTMMGHSEERLNYQRPLTEGHAVFVPAGTWHNIVNTGNIPLKLYTAYAPPQHPRGTVQSTKAVADSEGY